MRKMASIRTIKQIKPIPNADMLECAVVDGWEVVVNKGEYTCGDSVVYLEIDSWVPHDLAPFLSRGTPPKEYEGVSGYRLRTIRLRGQLSQGLVLPLSVLPAEPDDVIGSYTYRSADVSEILNIHKYEPPIPAQLAGEMEGSFPTHLVSKTDEERIQNICYESLRSHPFDFYATEKLDGTSATYIKHEGKLRVCSRNWELRDGPNTYWNVARDLDLDNVLEEGTIIQGEIIGPGIQGNKYKLNKHELYVFNIKGEIPDNIKRVPNFGVVTIQDNVTDMIDFASGPSSLNPEMKEKEGLVIRSGDNWSFKVINNKFLLKNE